MIRSCAMWFAGACACAAAADDWPQLQHDACLERSRSDAGFTTIPPRRSHLDHLDHLAPP